MADVDGTYYGFKNNTGQLVSLDLANGQTTVLGKVDPAAGFVFGATPVPEPISIALAGIGIAAIGIVRRVRPAKKG